MRAKEFIPGTKTIIPAGTITNESIIEFLRSSAKTTMSGNQRLKIAEHMASNEGKRLNEILDTELVSDIHRQLSAFAVKHAVVGQKYIPMAIDIFNDQIILYDVEKNSPPKTMAQFGELIADRGTEYTIRINDSTHTFPITTAGNYTAMIAGLFDTVDNYDKFRMIMKLKYDKDLPPVDPKSLRESASGYIPSNAQKNDPRYKTGLTKDVRPDSIQKNAKAFGFKISRAGIPPLLRK